MSIAKDKHISPGLPSEKPLSEAELLKLIKEAENGPFHTSAHVKEQIKKWQAQHSK